MTLRRIVAGGAALVLLMLLRGPDFSFAAGSRFEAHLEAVAACDQDAKPANLDFTLQDMNGADVALAAFRGKVILLNFWATWCGPCRIEVPGFVQLQEEYRDQGLVVLGLSVDDPASRITAFAAEFKVNYPMLVGLGRDDVQEAYGPILGMPTTFFIKRDGTVCKTHTGLATKDDVEKDIKELLALDVFDRSGRLRKQTLRSWTPPDGDQLGSCLDGVRSVRMIEDQVIFNDTRVFEGADRVQYTILGSVFDLGGRKLEVFNVNRTRIEESLGVDFLYFNEEFDAWTMVQYKLMEKEREEHSEVYRPDASFDDELRRMQRFRAEEPDTWQVEQGQSSYRLCGDGFYFKLCPRIRLEVLSDSLAKGIYLPRQLVEAMLEDGSLRGPRGGEWLASITLNDTSTTPSLLASFEMAG